MSRRNIQHVFVYGTLMDPHIIKAVTGKRFETRRAILYGYRKIDPPYSYPLLLPDPRHKVEGRLLLNVDADSLKRLDDYEDEGKLYQRCVVTVKTDDADMEAFVYFGKPHMLLKTRDLRAILVDIEIHDLF